MELQEIPGSNKSSKKDTKSHDRNIENQDDINTITPERNLRFGAYQQTMKCPYCRGKMTTRVESHPTIRTHLTAALLCLTCMWPCIPCVYCTDSCLVHMHYCDRCDKFLGRSSFLSSLRSAPKIEI